MLKPLCHLLTLLILQDRFPVGQFLGLPRAGQPTQALRHIICSGVCLDTQRDLKLKMEGCVLHLGSYPTWTKSVLHCPLPAIFPSATLGELIRKEASSGLKYFSKELTKGFKHLLTSGLQSSHLPVDGASLILASVAGASLAFSCLSNPLPHRSFENLE